MTNTGQENYSPPKRKDSKEEEWKELVRKNAEMNREMYNMLKSVKRFILFQRIWFGLKVTIILVPLILGFIYLPPLVEEWTNKYKDMLPMEGSGLWDRPSSQKEEVDQELLKEHIRELPPKEKEELLLYLQEQSQ